jgi:hypothetical protein
MAVCGRASALGRFAMDNYRLYRLRNGHISDVVVLAAETDEDARRDAEAHFTDAVRELWRGACLVAALPPSPQLRKDDPWTGCDPA